jgi:hypothetical protein
MFMLEPPVDQATLESFNQFLAQILRRSATDAAFRARCLAAPAEAYREATGQDLPAGMGLRFVAPGPGEILLPLPRIDPGPKPAPETGA